MKFILLIIYIFIISLSWLSAEDHIFATIIVKEDQGIIREKEYVECSLQLDAEQFKTEGTKLIVQELNTNEKIYCQIIEKISTESNNKLLTRFIFPVSISANQTKIYDLQLSSLPEIPASDLELSGKDFDLIIENDFYRADLTRNEKIEPQSYNSGQIRELFVKMGFDQLLTNAEDRVHWAPNFKRPELEWYTTIAHWQSPAFYQVKTGPYIIETKRRGPAPQHGEIDLTAVYKFYAHQPWFRFFSGMEMTRSVWLELLRNDEMTMDSMFTHLAFQRPDGEIVDVAFVNRHEMLKKRPVENEAPWLCFYNSGSGLAFGSIRIRYDINNQFGEPSPLYQPHTQIGEWLAGIKYWNRRLIHDHLTFVPEGSRYIEENAYLVFQIGQKDRFETIKYWTERIYNPLKVKIQYH